MAEKKIKIIAENRKARHDFTIHETYEAGIELTGTEVKSLRAGKANMKDSYAQITKTARSMFITCISALMIRVTVSTMSLCATAGCCCTARKYAA